MSDVFDDHEDEGLELDLSERELAERLSAERPVPAAGFRGALGRYLAAHDPGYGPRPEKLRLRVGAYVALGTALMALGAGLAVGWI
jgi:hypothetical protein